MKRSVKYIITFRFVQAESLMACFVVVTDVQPEIRREVTRNVGKTADDTDITDGPLSGV